MSISRNTLLSYREQTKTLLFQAAISLLILDNVVELVYYIQGNYDGNLSNDPVPAEWSSVLVKLVTYVSVHFVSIYLIIFFVLLKTVFKWMDTLYKIQP